MKLLAKNYNSPLATQGTFQDVFIEDVCITHKRIEKYLSITFQMYFIKNNQRINLCETTLAFLGMENDEVSTNQTTFVSIPNANYDVANIESTEKITVPLFGSNGNFTFDVTAIPFEVVDFGYPTYEKVMSYFNGGTLFSPEILISEPLAIGFLMNKLIMNGEPVGVQFKLEE